MNKSVIVSEKEGFLIADILAVEDWDGFESIGNYLEKYHAATILSKADGPESRVWEFESRNIKFSLHNNPYGNYLKFFNNEAAKNLMGAIINDLNNRLSTN